MHIVMAVAVGPRTTNGRMKPRRSTHEPKKGFRTVGNWRNIVKEPASARLRPNLRISNGRRGERNDVYRSWMK
jgi:hypothetical protein